MSSNPKVTFDVIFFSDGMIQTVKNKHIFINDNSFRGGKMFIPVKILTRIIEISVFNITVYIFYYLFMY